MCNYVDEVGRADPNPKLCWAEGVEVGPKLNADVDAGGAAEPNAKPATNQ